MNKIGVVRKELSANLSFRFMYHAVWSQWRTSAALIVIMGGHDNWGHINLFLNVPSLYHAGLKFSL